MSCPINQKPQSSLRQLYRTLKMKMIDAHKAGKGCKKIVKCFQVPSSSVWNVMKKGQLTETQEFQEWVRQDSDLDSLCLFRKPQRQSNPEIQTETGEPSNCNYTTN